MNDTSITNPQHVPQGLTPDAARLHAYYARCRDVAARRRDETTFVPARAWAQSSVAHFDGLLRMLEGRA